MSANDQNESTETPPKGVLVIDAFPHFQPIRLPAKEFYALHNKTSDGLDEFVDRHFEQFPQRAYSGRRVGR